MANSDEGRMSCIESNGTWSLCDLPTGHRPIGLKWVFKEKRNAADEVMKHKARLVAKGFVQRAGIDFEEVFAPVARLDSMRLLLAVAAQENWQVHHLDVKSAFLNGDLEEEVYVSPGFELAGKTSKVLRLHKALYGLRQAPRAWYAKLDGSLNTLGFEKCRPSMRSTHRLVWVVVSLLACMWTISSSPARPRWRSPSSTRR